MQRLKPAYLLTNAADGTVRHGWSVVVEGDGIVAVGPDEEVAHLASEVMDLPSCLLMPGLVNAHQHGRGISQVQLGYPDDRLEPWIAQRRRRGAPDAHALTLLAAAEMLRNGVTCAVHANYSYGGGDYEAECRAVLDAYVQAGIRVTFCVGAMDRGMLVYPGGDPRVFLGTLPPGAREAVERPQPPPYLEGASATIALMRRLQAAYADKPLVTLCYGPAGPQWVSDNLLSALAQDAREHELGMHLHMLESPAQAEICRTLFPEGTAAHLLRLGALGTRVALAHCVHLSDGDIAEIAKAGAIVVHNPGSNLRLSNGIAPIPKLLAAGIPVAVGTDNTAMSDDEDLWGELRLADMLLRLAGPPHQAAAYSAGLLDMLTGAGAAAAFVEERVGRLAPGMQADMIAIDLTRITGPYLDPDTSLPEILSTRARGRDVALTMVAGNVLYRDGELKGLDLGSIRRSAAETAQRHRLSPLPGASEAADALKEGLRSWYYTHNEKK